MPETDFGYDGSPVYIRELLVRTLRESERRLRARGTFDAAVGYQNLADAVESGQVKEWHGWDVTALYLGLHSFADLPKIIEVT